MARTVQLSEEAYRTLAALKEKGESFSDVVLRVVSEKKDLSALRRLSGRIEGEDDLREAMRSADRAKAHRLLRPGFARGKTSRRSD